MLPTIQSTGKGRVIDSSGTVSNSATDQDLLDSDSDDLVTPEYLDYLLNEARKNYAAAAAVQAAETTFTNGGNEEDIISLKGDTQQPTLPSLDLGKLPPAYFEFGGSRFDGPSSMRDPDVELAEKSSSSRLVPAPPIPPPEITKSGKPLTLKQKKELRNKTAGPDWFDLPAPPEADLPRLYQEVEALRLRNQLDPKRFYRKDEGEGKGLKGLPKYFAIGKILPSSTPFGTASGDNLARVHRKRTLLDELVDDAEAKRYTKKKFNELQKVRSARGKNTLTAKKALRNRKW